MEAPEKERPFINKILTGDVIAQLRLLPDDFVQMVVTSPPYFGLRQYDGNQVVVWGGDPSCAHEWDVVVTKKSRRMGMGERTEKEAGGDGKLAGFDEKIITEMATCKKCKAWRGPFGGEPTIELYVEHTILILREVRRVLRKDGVVYWNVGDSYASGGKSGEGEPRRVSEILAQKSASPSLDCQRRAPISPGLKPKDMNMIPFMVALAARADGWWVRSDIIWAKSNPMPEPVIDRPSKAHEYIFQLTKSDYCFYDPDPVRMPHAPATIERAKYHWCKKDTKASGYQDLNGLNRDENFADALNPSGRNLNTVWWIASHPYKEAHFATFPEAIPTICILAGTSEHGRCPTCGAPFERVIEKIIKVHHDSAPDEEYQKASGGHSGSRSPSKIFQQALNTKRVTVGWEPSCDCFGVEHLPKYPPWEDDEEPEAYVKRTQPIRERRAAIVKTYEPLPVIPCVVLDPFMGAGTTALVALNRGRNFVGIEINPGYVEMAYKRIDTPLKYHKLEDFL